MHSVVLLFKRTAHIVLYAPSCKVNSTNSGTPRRSKPGHNHCEKLERNAFCCFTEKVRTIIYAAIWPTPSGTSKRRKL